MFVTLTIPTRNPGLSADSKSQSKTTVILGRSRKNASIEIVNPAVPSAAPKTAVKSETIWMPFIVMLGVPILKRGGAARFPAHVPKITLFGGWQEAESAACAQAVTAR